jgi:hypothetical protein
MRRASMKTHFGDEKTTVRRSLLVVLGNQAVWRRCTRGRPIPGQGRHDDTVLQLKLSDAPWRKERVAAGCVGHVGYALIEV